jgi:hypothetical protein
VLDYSEVLEQNVCVWDYGQREDEWDVEVCLQQL